MVCDLPRVDIEHSTLGMPASNQQVEPVLLVNWLRYSRDVALLINVVKLKAGEVRLIQAMQFVMRTPKPNRLIHGHREEQGFAMLLELLQDFQAVIKMLNDLKGDDRVVLLQVILVDVRMNKLRLSTPTLS